MSDLSKDMSMSRMPGGRSWVEFGGRLPWVPDISPGPCTWRAVSGLACIIHDDSKSYRENSMVSSNRAFGPTILIDFGKITRPYRLE